MAIGRRPTRSLAKALSSILGGHHRSEEYLRLQLDSLRKKLPRTRSQDIGRGSGRLDTRLDTPPISPPLWLTSTTSCRSATIGCQNWETLQSIAKLTRPVPTSSAIRRTAAAGRSPAISASAPAKTKRLTCQRVQGPLNNSNRAGFRVSTGLFSHSRSPFTAACRGNGLRLVRLRANGISLCARCSVDDDRSQALYR